MTSEGAGLAFMFFTGITRRIVRTVWRWVIIGAFTINLILQFVAFSKYSSDIVEPWFFVLSIIFNVFILVMIFFSWMGREFIAITVFGIVLIAVGCFAPVYKINAGPSCPFCTDIRYQTVNIYGRNAQDVH